LAGVNTNITSITGLTGVLQAPTFVNDVNSNHVVGFGSNASAVNYLTLSNAATGSPPILAATGSDANVSLDLEVKAAGTFSFISSTLANYVSLSPAATTVPVAVTAQGSDSNIGIEIESKGTGQISLISTNTTSPLVIYNGTLSQHATTFAFANTNTSHTLTFPDYTGNVLVSSGANGTEAANAVTASGTSGVITTSSLTTAGGANYAITWTNTFIASTSVILLTLMGGTNTTNNITLKAVAGSGSSTLTIYNDTAATALNGTILIGYHVIP
jgi:hypothetical protein